MTYSSPTYEPENRSSESSPRVLALVRPPERQTDASAVDAEIDHWLRLSVRRLPAPWNLWAVARGRALRRLLVAELAGSVGDLTCLPLRQREECILEAIERVIGPYRNRLTLPAYAFLLGAVGLNACVVTHLSGFPALAAFAATFGGTVAGALGYQVLARVQAWAKQISSNGGSLRTEQIPFNGTALDIWRRSQQMKSDLPRDGRNIRKDSWLQLHPRLEKAIAFEHIDDGIEAIADALIDHRQSYGEVCFDYWLVREFHRNLKRRFGNERCYEAIRRVFRETAPRHGLPLNDLDRMLTALLRPETWR